MESFRFLLRRVFRALVNLQNVVFYKSGGGLRGKGAKFKTNPYPKM